MADFYKPKFFEAKQKRTTRKSGSADLRNYKVP